MPNPDILERTSVCIHKHLVELIKHVQSLNYVAEDSMLPIQIVGVISESDKELGRATAWLTIYTRRYSHRHCSLRGMFQAGDNIWHKVLWNIS